MSHIKKVLSLEGLMKKNNLYGGSYEESDRELVGFDRYNISSEAPSERMQRGGAEEEGEENESRTSVVGDVLEGTAKLLGRLGLGSYQDEEENMPEGRQRTDFKKNTDDFYADDSKENSTIFYHVTIDTDKAIFSRHNYYIGEHEGGANNGMIGNIRNKLGKNTIPVVFDMDDAERIAQKLDTYAHTSMGIKSTMDDTTCFPVFGIILWKLKLKNKQAGGSNVKNIGKVPLSVRGGGKRNYDFAEKFDEDPDNEIIVYNAGANKRAIVKANAVEVVGAKYLIKHMKSEPEHMHIGFAILNTYGLSDHHRKVLKQLYDNAQNNKEIVKIETEPALPVLDVVPDNNVVEEQVRQRSSSLAEDEKDREIEEVLAGGAIDYDKLRKEKKREYKRLSKIARNMGISGY
jgi:hypothetical protein